LGIGDWGLGPIPIPNPQSPILNMNINNNSSIILTNSIINIFKKTFSLKLIYNDYYNY